MRIDEQARECVSFLGIKRQGSQPDRSAFIPVGTMFYVGVAPQPERWVVYGVTARHVVDASRPHGDLYVRLLDSDSRLTMMRFPVDYWWVHPTTDVAVVRISFDLGQFGLKFLPLYLFSNEEWLRKHEVGVGDRLLVSGMFSQYIGDQRDEPILRFGRISLIPREKVRVPPQQGLPGMEIEAVLAETASWGGESGSPVFVYFSIDRGLFVGDHIETQLPNPRLLGLLHGHFTVREPVIDKDSEYPDLQIPLNAGIAVVVPATKIQEVLMLEEVVEDRERGAGGS